MSAADVRDALHRAHAAIIDAERAAAALPPASLEVTGEDRDAARTAYSAAYTPYTRNAALDAALDALTARLAGRHSVPQPAATGRREPTQADALRAAARVLDGFDRPLYVDLTPRGVVIGPDYGVATAAGFDALRALARQYGATPVDAAAAGGPDTEYCRPEFTLIVDGVPLRVSMQVGGGHADELVAEVRAWIAEAAS